MKIELKIKSVQYAKNVAEFLYKLHPVVLKEQVEAKESFGDIFGMIDLNYLDYNKREQLASLNSDNKTEQLANLNSGKKNLYQISIEEIKKKLYETSKEEIEYNKYLNDISKSERKDFINIDFYIEVEDRQYGRMLAEFFDNLTEGCLEQAVLCKREEDEDAKLIGRYTEVGDKLTEEESKILKENRWYSEK